MSFYKRSLLTKWRYFVQIERNTYNNISVDKIHPDYNILRKTCKGKDLFIIWVISPIDLPSISQISPISLVRLKIDEFDSTNPEHEKIFQKHFPKLTIEKLKNSHKDYLVVDEFGNQLGMEREDVDIEIYKRFIKGPLTFTDHNQLFEYLDSNKKSNKHYFIVYSKHKRFWNKKFSPKMKLFRKFYTENSGFFHPQVEFIEVSGLISTFRLGIKEEGVIHHFTNQLEEISVKGEPSSFYNLKLVKNIHHLSTEKGKFLIKYV